MIEYVKNTKDFVWIIFSNDKVEFSTLSWCFLSFSLLSILLLVLVLVILLLHRGDDLVVLNGVYGLLLVTFVNLPIVRLLFPAFFMVLWKNFLMLAYHFSLLLIYTKNYPKIILDKTNTTASFMYEVLIGRGALISIVVPACILFLFLGILSLKVPREMHLNITRFNIARFDAPNHNLFIGLVWAMAFLTSILMIMLLINLERKRKETKRKLSQSVITKTDVLKCFVNVVIYLIYSVAQSFPPFCRKTSEVLEFSNCLTGIVFFLNFGLSRFVRNVYSDWLKRLTRGKGTKSAVDIESNSTSDSVTVFKPEASVNISAESASSSSSHSTNNEKGDKNN